MHVRMCFPWATRLTVLGNPPPRLIRLTDADTALVSWDEERFCDLGPFLDLLRQAVELAKPHEIDELMAQDERVADVLAEQSPLVVGAE